MLWKISFCTILALASAINLPGVPKDLKASDDVLSAIADDIANKFSKEFLAYRKTGIESATLRQISTQLAKSHSKKDIFTKDPFELSPADSFFLCTTCRATASVAIKMVRDPDGELNGPNADENAKTLTLEFCRRFDLQTQEVCLGLYESNWPIIQFIARESEMDSRTFCSLFLEFNFCKLSNTAYNFTLNIDPTGAPITGPKNDIPKTSSDIAVLHITDLHYDELYEPGSLAGCEEPLCCQRHKDIAEGTSRAAGYWGDYRDCDAPWQLIENSLEHIKETHKKIDYIYHTGDVVDHMVWATSKQKNKDVLSKVDNKLAEMFPGIPVYPCIGNHEPHPLNAFSPEDAPEDINTNWLYEHLYESWSKWLPDSTKDTILKGGYYTVSPKSGFRIITLNNNDCYNMNWWLFYKSSNKIPQLQWLHDTLLAAEKSMEYVHILTHIPTGGTSCWSVWSREFNRIIVRFSGIISGIFNGHTHKDEMYLHYSPNGHAVGVVWNGGSITPASNKNPNYRFYQLEDTSCQVVEAETWTFNLTLANERGSTVPPEWYKMYDFRTEFTTDTSPHGIDKLLDDFSKNPNHLRKYWEYLNTQADPRLAEGCNRQCLLNTICRIALTYSEDTKRCEELKEALSKTLDEDDTTSPATSPTTITTPPESETSSTTSGTSSTTSGTSSTTSSTTPGTSTTPEGDGAASLIAMSFSSIVALHLLVKYFL